MSLVKIRALRDFSSTVIDAVRVGDVVAVHPGHAAHFVQHGLAEYVETLDVVPVSEPESPPAAPVSRPIMSVQPGKRGRRD